MRHDLPVPQLRLLQRTWRPQCGLHTRCGPPSYTAISSPRTVHRTCGPPHWVGLHSAAPLPPPTHCTVLQTHKHVAHCTVLQPIPNPLPTTLLHCTAVLLGPSGRCLVADWGLARRWGAGVGKGMRTVDMRACGLWTCGHLAPCPRSKHHTHLTQDQGIPGTPAYTAPEVFQNAKVDERADVFSFSMLLWALLTGRHPWQELDNCLQVMSSVGWWLNPAPPTSRGSGPLSGVGQLTCRASQLVGWGVVGIGGRGVSEPAVDYCSLGGLPVHFPNDWLV